MTRLLIHGYLCGLKGNSTPANAAVPIRILRQILLVIVLCVEELRRVANLGGDRAAPCCREARLVCALRRLRGIALLRVRGVDRRAVLSADVVSLPHALRRIVRLPEHPEQILVVDLLR